MQESNTPQGQDNTTDRANDAQNGSALRNPSLGIGGNPPPPPEHTNADNHSGQPLRRRILDYLRFGAEIIILVVTIRIACIYSAQLFQMVESNRINRDALESVQRAFVSPRRVEVTPIPDNKSKQAVGVQIEFGWDNNGTTPAKTLTQHISTRWDDKPIPDNFDFPDEWLPGEEHITNPTYIGPKSSLGGGIFIVPVPILMAIQKGTRHVYYWGWAKYHDVFSQEHLTEVCFELKSNGTPLGSTSNFPFRLDECTKHNCIDEDCKR
jgi:hypothetical protein